MEGTDHARARAAMVRNQVERRGIADVNVRTAMRDVPRHLFVPERYVDEAYADRPLPIGHGATISQPYVVALMLELAGVGPGARVLDVGTGSGYQAAVLAAMGAEVFGVELVEPLVDAARLRLASLGLRTRLRLGDGHQGWDAHGPYDAIVVAAAPSRVPSSLTHQLAPGGRLVLPVGPRYRQDLTVVTRDGDTYLEERGIPVAFVPLVGPQTRLPARSAPHLGEPEADRA